MDWMESTEVEEKEYEWIRMMKTMRRRKIMITMMQNTKSRRCTTRRRIKTHPLLNNQHIINLWPDKIVTKMQKGVQNIMQVVKFIIPSHLS